MLGFQGPLRRLVASQGANGFGRHNGFGQSFRITRSDPNVTAVSRNASYDGDQSCAPVLLLRERFSDGVVIEVIRIRPPARNLLHARFHRSARPTDKGSLLFRLGAMTDTGRIG